MLATVKKHTAIILGFVLVAFLILKYGYTLVRFPQVPIGYDAGIYRFLFVHFGDALPPASVPDLPPWARAHALGLFFFSSIFSHLGVSADALIGPLWNMFQVFLFGVLALVYGRRRGVVIGLLVLLVALLSPVQYEGFLLMYWKVMAALLFCTFAFDASERRSPAIILWGMLTVATHQQIGLIYGLSIIGALLLEREKGHSIRFFGYVSLSIILGLLWYIPNYHYAIAGVVSEMMTVDTAIVLAIIVLILGCGIFAYVAAPRHRQWMLLALGCAIAVPILLFPFAGIAPGILFHSLLGRMQTNPGVFLSGSEYLKTSFPLLLFGVIGFIFSVRSERVRAEHIAVVISGLGVVSMLFLYRRFLLPLDFFLLPFAALTLKDLWQLRRGFVRIAIALLLLAQAGFLIDRMQRIEPGLTTLDLQEVRRVGDNVPPHSVIVSLDTFAPWVLGMVPDSSVVGPGIFDSLPMEAWQGLLYGTPESRRAFFEYYDEGTYFYASRLFRDFYPPTVQEAVFSDTCLVPETVTGLFRSTCGRGSTP